jgi:hypothetical protein
MEKNQIGKGRFSIGGWHSGWGRALWQADIWTGTGGSKLCGHGGKGESMPEQRTKVKAVGEEHTENSSGATERSMQWWKVRRAGDRLDEYSFYALRKRKEEWFGKRKAPTLCTVITPSCGSVQSTMALPLTQYLLHWVLAAMLVSRSPHLGISTVKPRLRFAQISACKDKLETWN